MTAVTSKENIDNVLALDILKDSKFCITGLAKASTETTHQLLRDFMDSSLSQCMEEHFQLTDLLVIKGWYHPNHIAEQLQTDFALAQTLSNQPAHL